MLGNVFTVYELYAGEETLGSSAHSCGSFCGLWLGVWVWVRLVVWLTLWPASGLHGMEPWLLREALTVLEGEGKVRSFWLCAVCVAAEVSPRGDSLTSAPPTVLSTAQAAIIAGETCEEDGVKFLATD